jgi:hypothetical protein
VEPRKEEEEEEEYLITGNRYEQKFRCRPPTKYVMETALMVRDMKHQKERCDLSIVH